MKTKRIVLFVLLCLCAVFAAHATPMPQVSGWIWMDPDNPYGYSYNESGWLYFADPAGPIWFYNFASAQWSDIGPSGWSWFQYPYTYSLDLGTWIYVQAPAGGIYVYHFVSQVWTLLN